MSQAKKNRSKQRRREADAKDSERKEVRNLIRKGKMPRYSVLRSVDGKIPRARTLRFKTLTSGNHRGKATKQRFPKRFMHQKYRNFIRSSFGLVFNSSRKQFA